MPAKSCPKYTWRRWLSPVRAIPRMPHLRKARKTLRNWNSKRLRPRRRPSSTPRPAAPVPSMHGWKFVPRRERRGIRSAPSGRGPATARAAPRGRRTGTVDARVEVRAPAGTAGYTQRTQRPRPGYDRDRQGGPRDRQRRGGGGRRFRRRENSPVPLISDLLKEGQEILVQIAKEPIGK